MVSKIVLLALSNSLLVHCSMISDTEESSDGSMLSGSADDLAYISAESEDSFGFGFPDLSTDVNIPDDMQLGSSSPDSENGPMTHPFVPHFFEPPAINPAVPSTSNSVWRTLWGSDDYVKHRVHQLTMFPTPLFPPSMIGEARDPYSPSDRAPVGHPGIQRAFLLRAIGSGITTWPELSVLLSCFCTTSPFLGLPYHQLIGELLFPRIPLPNIIPQSGSDVQPVA